MNVVIALVLLFLLIALSLPAIGAQRKSETNTKQAREEQKDGVLMI